MAKNWGRTPITNADKRLASNVKFYVETKNGPEMRVARSPLGRSEQFVDVAGNICNEQMYNDGDSRKLDTEQRNRAGLHRKGFIEYAKCPIRHGTQMHAQRDFAKMPAHLAKQCDADPRPFVRRNFQGEIAQRGEPGDVYALESCPHIEWLIDFRRKQTAEAAAKRNPHAAAAEASKKQAAELQAAQIELTKAQAADLKRRKPKDAGE